MSSRSLSTLAPIASHNVQYDWIWRGWSVRYTYLHNHNNNLPVFLVHGFGGSIGHWRQNMTELGNHHSVYAFDLLGFGASDKPNTSYSIQLWVEQIYEFWQTFIKVPVVLVGNSLGSATCLAAATAYPDMVQGVAMISLPNIASSEGFIPPLIQGFVSRLRNALISPLFLVPLFHLLKQPCILRGWVRLAYAGEEAITDDLLEILAAPTKEKGSAQAFCAILSAMLSPQFSPCVKSILSNLKIPSLLLWGKQDKMIPRILANSFLGCNPKLRFVELENAGHCAHDECPERVNCELLNWIQREVLAASGLSS
jgi:pimeloyl-ACP methyl ester carboxylesterase